MKPKFKVGDIVYICSPITGEIEKKEIVSISGDKSPHCYYHFIRGQEFHSYCAECLCFKTKQDAAQYYSDLFKRDVEYYEDEVKRRKDHIKNRKKQIARLAKILVKK